MIPPFQYSSNPSSEIPLPALPNTGFRVFIKALSQSRLEEKSLTPSPERRDDMFGKRINLFKLLGFQVRIDLSWIIIAALIIWSLSSGLFPHYFPGFSNNIYWFIDFCGQGFMIVNSSVLYGELPVECIQ